MEPAEEPAQSRQKNHWNHNQDEDQPQYDVVNQERQKTRPESSVRNARHGSVSSIHGDRERATSHGGRRNRRTHHWRSRRGGGDRERLTAIRAKRGAIRHRSAALGTVHSVSFIFPARPANRQESRANPTFKRR